MNEHGLTRENLLSTFPAALAKDPAVYALAEAAADLLAGRLEEIKMVNLYAQIDRLEEPLLDILAQDFKVDWWNPGYTLEEKRRTLRDSWKVHRTLGTKAAVVTAISAIYPKTDVQEWFEYGGEPFHFKIKIDLTGEKMNGERPKQVLERVNFYKSLRSHLDSITASSALEPVRICTAALFYKTRSRTTLPLLEPELPGCSISLGAAMGRGRSRTTLPMLDVAPPEMRGGVHMGAHTGTYMHTCLPVLEDFTSIISMNCRAGLSAGFISRSKTKLPEWEEML